MVGCSGEVETDDEAVSGDLNVSSVYPETTASGSRDRHGLAVTNSVVLRRGF